MLGKGVHPGWVPSLTGNPRLTSWSENFLLAPSALSIPKGSPTTTVPGEQAERAGRGLLLAGLGAGLQMVPLTPLPLLSLMPLVGTSLGSVYLPRYVSGVRSVCACERSVTECGLRVTVLCVSTPGCRWL